MRKVELLHGKKIDFLIYNDNFYQLNQMSSTQELLIQVQNGEISIDEAQHKLKQLKLSDLKRVTYKISPKGAISFYGLRKMPITIYLEELEQIVEIANGSEFKEYIKQNTDKLSTKEKNREK